MPGLKCPRVLLGGRRELSFLKEEATLVRRYYFIGLLIEAATNQSYSLTFRSFFAILTNRIGAKSFLQAIVERVLSRKKNNWSAKMIIITYVPQHKDSQVSKKKYIR